MRHLISSCVRLVGTVHAEANVRIFLVTVRRVRIPPHRTPTNVHQGKPWYGFFFVDNWIRYDGSRQNICRRMAYVISVNVCIPTDTLLWLLLPALAKVHWNILCHHNLYFFIIAFDTNAFPRCIFFMQGPDRNGKCKLSASCFFFGFLLMKVRNLIEENERKYFLNMSYDQNADLNYLFIHSFCIQYYL